MIQLEEYGFVHKNDGIPEGLLPARVTQVNRERYQVVCGRGHVPAVLKGSFLHQVTDRDEYPAVGDFVLMQHNEAGDSLITALLPRRTKFSRTDFQGHAAGYVKTIVEQVVAANFDTVLILSSLNLDFNINRIGRYVSATLQSGAQPVVVLTKRDLCADWREKTDVVYQAMGDVPVHAVSSVSGEGLEELSAYLQPAKTLVCLGMSGVGKSSLLNALIGQEVMEVRGIREDDSRGRHTTTHRQLFRLPGGALFIDTPGMRELGLWNASEGIGMAFVEVEELMARCRFANCTHSHEPGCAILGALETGELSHETWARYLDQRREAAFVKHKQKPAKPSKEIKKKAPVRKRSWAEEQL